MGHKAPDIFAGMIIENTFTSISDMAEELFPIFKYRPIRVIKQILLRIGWYSDQLVGDITIPILYITGQEDEIVPYTQTLKLHALSTKSALVELYMVKDGSHMDTWFKDISAYMEKVNNFMIKCISI